MDVLADLIVLFERRAGVDRRKAEEHGDAYHRGRADAFADAVYALRVSHNVGEKEEPGSPTCP